MKHPLLKSVLCAAAFAATLAASPAWAAESASATLKTSDGKDAGTLTLQQTPNGVLVMGDVMNITPGWHAVHLHETGACDGDFTSAGGHFNPAGKEHGFDNPDGYHAGDMPNVYVGDDGKAQFNFLNAQVSLGDGDMSLGDSDGSAVIVHAGKDSYGKDAGAGAREACGVITMK
jgi:Cu-Zn family superoxide dismutase